MSASAFLFLFIELCFLMLFVIVLLDIHQKKYISSNKYIKCINNNNDY